MIKKILIIIFIFSSSSSCGKKGDPIFNENTQSLGFKSVHVSKLS